MKKVISSFCVFILSIQFYTHIVYAEEKISINGTGDNQMLLQDLVRIFEQSHPGKRIEVPESIGSTSGIRATAAGVSDLGRVSRLLNDKENKYNLSYRLFAYAPVVFALHQSVEGIDNLTYEQIVGIYSGKLRRWEELAGQAGKIYIVNREKGDSSRISLERNIPDFKKITKFVGEIVYSPAEALAILTKNRNTIGYIPLSIVKGTDLHVVRINGVEPTAGNVQMGNYKLAVPFALVWKGSLDGLAAEFVNFLFSPQSQMMITEYGAIPVKE